MFQLLPGCPQCSSLQQGCCHLWGVIVSCRQRLDVRCCRLSSIRAPCHRPTWCSCRYSPASRPGRLYGSCHMTSSLLAPSWEPSCNRYSKPSVLPVMECTLEMLWYPVIESSLNYMPFKKLNYWTEVPIW